MIFAPAGSLEKNYPRSFGSLQDFFVCIFVGLRRIDLNQNGSWNLDATVVSTDRVGFLSTLHQRQRRT